MKKIELQTLSKHWAIEPTALQCLRTDLSELQSGLSLFAQKPLARTYTSTIRDGIAVIPIHGIITARSDLFTFLMGGTGLDILARDIPVILADSSKYDWFTDLLKVDSNYLKPLQVFFMLDDAYTYKQHFKENYSIERALKNTIHKYWDDTLPPPMTREEFQEYFLEQFGIEITDDNISDIYITHPEWHCPDNNGSLLNKMWSDIGMISRDPHMVKCIFDAVNSHDCVLATFGAGHLNKQIRILEQAFGKPTFVDIKA